LSVEDGRPQSGIKPWRGVMRLEHYGKVKVGC
jgi:hypothetical protein